MGCCLSPQARCVPVQWSSFRATLEFGKSTVAEMSQHSAVLQISGSQKRHGNATRKNTSATRSARAQAREFERAAWARQTRRAVESQSVAISTPRPTLPTRTHPRVNRAHTNSPSVNRRQPARRSSSPTKQPHPQDRVKEEGKRRKSRSQQSQCPRSSLRPLSSGPTGAYDIEVARTHGLELTDRIVYSDRCEWPFQSGKDPAKISVVSRRGPWACIRQQTIALDVKIALPSSGVSNISVTQGDRLTGPRRRTDRPTG